ncbi:MAG: IS21-like element helper ATPase IstB [Azoarcus sp.]|jgi:DNA replication protein DnaC|nr:IS21-like element helper ATPase IstB [Azoarcus sp.]
MSEKPTIQRLAGMLGTFGIKHSSKGLADLLESAAREESAHREFLSALLEMEIRGRNARRRHRNYAAAHFPPVVRRLEEFDPSELESGITDGQIRQLRELGWLDSYGNILLAGPPGLGKTMLALGIGLHAIDEGYTVCFEKMDGFIDILDRAGHERGAGFRLRNIKKAQLVIIDEIGYTPISRDQANRFFNFVSDAYERASIIFTTNRQIPEWAEMLGDATLTAAMLDRILHHARCFSLKGEPYRLKHPETYA